MKSLLDLHQRLLTDSSRSFLMNLALILLIPLSIVYGLVSWLRLWCYQCGIFPAYKSTLPVISVGNLSVGGTGKTPVVDWLVKQLQKKGWQPAIVSRGYGGEFSGAFGFVSAGKETLMNPSNAGDEPFLLAKRNPQVPVLIARKRVHAIKEIERTDCADVIILDDAFQHYAVARHLDIVLLDAKRPFGNGWPLPAGNLREFPRVLKRADFILKSRSEEPGKDIGFVCPVFNSRHCLEDHITSLGGDKIPLDYLVDKQVIAFAGISSPDSFFNALIKCGVGLQSALNFSDHEPYSAQKLAQINDAARGADALITTEKDAVKLNADMFSIPCYKIAVTLEIDDAEILLEQIIDMIRSRK